MKKRKTWILFAVVILLLAAVIGRVVYGRVAVRSLSSEIPQIEQTDTCEIRWTSSLPPVEHIDLTLTGEELDTFLNYLSTVQVTAPLRGRGYELKGQYYIGFYSRGEQTAEMIVSSTGELGILYGQRFHYYQAEIGDQEEFTIPLSSPDPGALTAEELRWFQEVFFRSGTDNIRNVFGRPGEENVYERPQDIDLYELFYDGSHLGAPVTATEAEIKAAYPDLADEEITTPAYRVTRVEMDEVLLKYTGLTLAETNRVGLDKLPYLEERDAYYWMHGGTGYPGPLTILGGEREGSTVRLYQEWEGAFYCLTLEQQSEGNYWFVSNLPVSEDAMP